MSAFNIKPLDIEFKPDIKPDIKLNIQANITQTNTSDDPFSNLPSLPPITDHELSTTVLTHKALKTLRGLSEDYEKLAHVGDSLLGMAVTTLIRNLYPKLEKGPATNLRKKLVCEETLNLISRAYGIPTNPHGGCPITLSIQDTDRNSAEMFEGYIAGVFYDHTKTSSHGEAYEVIREWLWELFTPFARRWYNPIDVSALEEDNLAKNGKADLHKWWQQVGQKSLWSGLHFDPQEDRSACVAGSEGLRWKVVVSIVDPQGVRRSEEATRIKQIEASNVACWKLMRQIEESMGRRFK